MKIITIIISAVCIIFSTNQQEIKEYDNVALSFMNSYVLHCNNVFKKIDKPNDSLWVLSNKFVTKKFKQSYMKLLNKSNNEEEGYIGSDPILDAQDYPDSGFVILNTMDKFGYVKLKGKNLSEFVAIVRVKKVNNHWLVDGAGEINIPSKYRVSR